MIEKKVNKRIVYKRCINILKKLKKISLAFCDWGDGKDIKILEPPKRKGGYPECNLIKGD